MNTIFKIIGLLLVSIQIIGQNNYFGRDFRIGAGYSSIKIRNDGIYLWTEKNYNFFSQVRLTKSTYIELEMFLVNFYKEQNMKDRGQVVSLNFQWIPIELWSFEPYIELGLGLGNYCACGGDIPYIKNNLVYFGREAGLNFNVYKKIIYIKAGLSYQSIIGKRNDGYNKPLFGLMVNI